jgi:dihydroxyacetone kinase
LKKLINDPRDVVREMLEGYAALTPGWLLLGDENVLIRAGLPTPADRSVAILSGGGSGHEPAHAGYVGPGMLTAAVSGDVFTSPSADQIHAAILACAGPAGAVLVVKNYTGDRLNFALAAELAHADGIPCEIVVVADDVALRDVLDQRDPGGNDLRRCPAGYREGFHRTGQAPPMPAPARQGTASKPTAGCPGGPDEAEPRCS